MIRINKYKTKMPMQNKIERKSLTLGAIFKCLCQKLPLKYLYHEVQHTFPLHVLKTLPKPVFFYYYQRK